MRVKDILSHLKKFPKKADAVRDGLKIKPKSQPKAQPKKASSSEAE